MFPLDLLVRSSMFMSLLTISWTFGGINQSAWLEDLSLWPRLRLRLFLSVTFGTLAVSRLLAITLFTVVMLGYIVPVLAVHWFAVSIDFKSRGARDSIGDSIFFSTVNTIFHYGPLISKRDYIRQMLTFIESSLLMATWCYFYETDIQCKTIVVALYLVIFLIGSCLLVSNIPHIQCLLNYCS